MSEPSRKPQPRVVIDPYIKWAQATQFAYFFTGRYAERRIPVIIRLAEPLTAQQFARGEWNPPGKRDEWKSWLRIPARYEFPPLGAKGSRFCTASVTRRFFEELRIDSSLSRVVARVGLGVPISDRRPPPIRSRLPWWRRIFAAVMAFFCRVLGSSERPHHAAAQANQNVGVKKSAKNNDDNEGKGKGKGKDRNEDEDNGEKKPKTVVTAVIDDGLAFAHARFRLPDGSTRVECFWNQDGPLSDPLGYGWELHKQDVGPVRGIDGRLADSSHAGLVDEDELYRNAGHINFGLTGHKPVAWRTAHGTHVMDLAFGYPPSAAPDTRPIVAVQLPVAATTDTSGGSLAPHVLDGIDYILDCAGERRVVINISYGTTSGPHDGTSDLELAIDDRIRERRAANAPMAVVLPSGNSRQWRTHAQFALPANVTQALVWRVIPDDSTPSYLEIWLPNADGQNPVPAVEVRVTPPGGPASGWVREGDPSFTWPAIGNVIYQIDYINWAVAGHRGMMLIATAPTTSEDPVGTVAPFGRWLVEVRNIGPALDLVHAWIRRDDTPYGYPQRGRQSYFDDPNYRRFDDAGREVHNDVNSYIHCDSTISGLATGEETVVIGGFRRSDLSAAEYSAGGPIVTPPGGIAHRAGPDAMAVSEDSVTRHGVMAAGSRSGSVVAMYGTSVAAPQVARWLADQMAAGNAFGRNAVNALAVLQENARPVGTPAPPPVQRGGGGRIEFPPQVTR